MQSYAPRESGAPQASSREGFAPLPLRARGTLELLDASIKIYRQYFGVLLGWSAIVSLASVLGAFLPGVGLLSFLLTPLLFGAIMCCVAAAVRGQRVSFGQCWDFTKPRYGPLIIAYLLSGLVAMGLAFLAIIVFAALFGIGGSLLSSDARGITGVMAILAILILGTIAFTRLTIWMSMVPVVVCMEEDKRGGSSLRRANELLKGHYGRITGLMVLLGLGFLVLASIFMGMAGLITGADQLRALANGGSDSTALIKVIAGFGTSFMLLSMVTTPLFYLIIALFYLDVRVRKEALDLEWSAHVTAPVAPETLPAPGFMTLMNPAPSAPQTTSYAPSPEYPPAYAPPQYPPAASYPAASTPYPAPDAPLYSAPTSDFSATPNAAAPSEMQPVTMPAPFAAPAASVSDAPSMPAPFATDAPPAVAPPFANSSFGDNAAAPPADMTFVPTPAPIEFAPQGVQPAPLTSDVQAPQTQVTCANCGATAPRGQRFCMQCGSNLPAA